MTIMEPNAAVDAGAPDLSAGIETALPGQIPGQRPGATSPDGDPSAAPSDGADIATPAPATDDAITRMAEEAAENVPITPVPLPILPVRMRTLSGTYRSPAAGYQMEFRADVDGARRLGRMSGDYYSVSGTSTSYFGSWTVDAVKVTATTSTLTIVGTARTTWSTSYTVARVTIPRTTISQSAAPATVRWFTPSGAAGAVYTCAWAASSFRVVELEQDCESNVTPFVSHDTATLPGGGADRILTVSRAYAEAGIRMLDTGGANIVRTAANHLWNNASLHHAMQRHFSRWAETPQFKVWLLHAWAHEFGVGLRGIMFDQQGLQRQGCASFYQAISAPTDTNRREQLYVHVHELGHCFNLFHSFHKNFMNPPLPNRPGSLSWMNYPQNYNPGGGAPGGAAAFWSAFPFQFDDLELAHLRHGFRNHVIMGGTPFGTGAALDVSSEYGDLVVDHTGLSLHIATSPARPVLGEPVVLEISLAAEAGRRLHHLEQLHPKYGQVTVAVSGPGGEVVVHKPPLEHCAEPAIIVAERGEEQRASAYIGYDAAEGHLFDAPGTYRIRAAYATPDGDVIVSNVATVRVAVPHSREEDDVAELMLQEETGMVLTLLGTDSDHLARGSAALQTVLDEHADSPMAIYARLAEGTNLARPFYEVLDDGSVRVRERDLDRAEALLRPAVDASRGDAGLDDATVFQTLGYLKHSHAEAGDDAGAEEIRADVVALARSKGAPRSVLEALDE
jgi:hypothetical protein